MPRLIGSRRGVPLLPLWAQWPSFVLSAAWCIPQVLHWARGDADAFPGQHAQLAALSLGVALLAWSGLVRRRRALHVALFAAGGACILLAAALRWSRGP